LVDSHYLELNECQDDICYEKTESKL